MIYINSFIERTPVDIKIFKGGEVNVCLSQKQINHIREFNEVEIWAHITSSDMLMALALTVDAIRSVDTGKVDIGLIIPYFPYARQDRVCNPGEALSVRVAAKIVNMLNVDRLFVIDPHSDVTPALLNNCKVITQTENILTMTNDDCHKWDELLRITKSTWILAPDAGAVKKIHALCNDPQVKDKIAGYVTATKTRNIMSGEITGTQINAAMSGADVLVVDDICDGGRTFIELAKVLKEDKVGKLSLYVTHGIFSYGVEELLKHYDYIYTTNSFHPDPNSALRKQWTDHKDADGNPRIVFSAV